MTTLARDPQHQLPDLGDLKSRLDCRDLYQSLVGTGKPSGKAWVDRTPWREDHKPSLNIYTNGWLDRATGERGDVFSLVQNIRGIRFSVAVEFVASWLGISTPLSSPYLVARPQLANHPSPATTDPPSESWQIGAQKAVVEAERYLWSNHRDAEAALAYLRHERGLSDETIRAARLGFNSQWAKTTCRKPDTGNTIAYASLAPGIVIPWLINDVLWAIKVRTVIGTLAEALGRRPERLDGKPSPKYLNLAGGNQAAALYNAALLQAGLPVLFVEGEFDALLGQQWLGEKATLVTLGSASNGLAPRWLEQVRACPIALSAMDNDLAGQKAAARLATQLGSHHRASPLPAGKDLTEYIVDHHGNPLTWFEAELNAAPKPYWYSLPDGWRAAVNAYLPDSLTPFLERLVAVGWFVPGYTFIRPQALTELGLSRATVDHGLEAGEGVFWQRITVLPPDSSLQKKTELAIGKSVITYRLFTLPEMTAAFLKRAACRIWERCNPVESGQPLGRPQVDFFTELGYSTEEAQQIVAELEVLLQPTYRSQGNAERFAERLAKREYDRLKRSLADASSTPLPDGWRYTNVHEYRACFARAIKQAAPGCNYSLKEWSAKLGISVRSVAGVLERARIDSVAQYQEAEVYSMEEVAQVGRKLKGYPKRLIIQAEGQQEHECRYDPERLAGALRLGQRCTVRYQLVNKQTLATDEPRDQPVRKVVSARRPVPSDVIASRPPAAPRLKPERPAAYRGPGYDPGYVQAWLVQACDLARDYGLLADGRLIDHETGEVLVEQPTASALLWVLLGRHTSDLVRDELVAFVMEQLDATVTAVLYTDVLALNRSAVGC